MNKTEVRYPQVRVRLANEDGNAFAILARVKTEMRRCRVPESEIARYLHEATISDYDNLLRTTMEWVNCDGMGNDNIGRRYTNLSPAMQEYWEGVRDAVQDAHLIAWDTCHKTYLAMDAEQADWFRASDYTVFHGSPDEMFATLRRWYDESCGLKFIQAVATDHDDPNKGYDTLIPQGAEDEDKCDECGADGLYCDDLCLSCWEDMNEEEED